MGKVISFVNAKGGVAKTTSAINIAEGFCRMKYKCLLVDFDPQGGATTVTGFSYDELDGRATMAEVVMRDNVSIKQIIKKTPNCKFDIAPANIDLSLAEPFLYKKLIKDGLVKFSSRLKEKLEPIIPDYDYIFIDNQPNLGCLPINSISASDYLVIPVAAEWMSLKGLNNVLKLVNDLVFEHNSDVEVLGILPTMFDTRNNVSKGVLDVLVKVCKQNNLSLIKTVIPRSVKVQYASIEQQSILDHSPESDPAKAYLHASFLIEKMCKKKGE